MTTVRAPEVPKFTYQDYLLLPDDGKRYQIIEGEVYIVPAPGPNHQRVVGILHSLLRAFVTVHALGEVFLAPCDVVLSQEDVVQPDLFFISKGRRHLITEKNISGAPDLVIEILSPHTEKLDRTLKRKLYAKYGVPEYWLVDPVAKTVEILALRGEVYTRTGLFGVEDELRSPLLGGPLGPVSEVFSEIETA
ncbi:MAG: Uma2 family endonuclease [Anaerolineae bacterium]